MGPECCAIIAYIFYYIYSYYIPYYFILKLDKLTKSGRRCDLLFTELRRNLHQRFETDWSCWQWNFFGIRWNSPVYKVADHCSVFLAKMVAIQTSPRIIGDEKVSKRNITIYSDSQAAIKALSSNGMNSKTVYSQAAIKALSSNVMNSKTVYVCHRFLNKIVERYDIHIV